MDRDCNLTRPAPHVKLVDGPMTVGEDRSDLAEALALLRRLAEWPDRTPGRQQMQKEVRFAAKALLERRAERLRKREVS